MQIKEVNMNDRIKYRYWINEDWHNPNSKLEPVYCNIVDGCEPTTAISDFEFCTGLKDKNGNLIYEGDIVKGEKINPYSSFHKDYVNYYEIEVRWFKNGFDLDPHIYEYTIIGNIHKNPELLEEDKMSIFDNMNEDINNFFNETTNFINKHKDIKMDKTNKTFAEFAVKNGWKRTEADKDGTVVYYGNMGILITKDYQLKPVFVFGDTYIDIGLNSYIYGEYARDIVKFTKKEATND